MILHRRFVVRARSTPVVAAKFREGVGKPPHVEYLAQMVVQALFLAKGHREDAVLQLVLESSADLPRMLTLDGSDLGNLGGLDEAAVIRTLADALHAGAKLRREAAARHASGVTVAATTFEQVARTAIGAGATYLLDRKGADIREIDLDPASVFLLSDHVPMPRNSVKGLLRLGAVPISLGPRMLQASQCMAVINNELDRR